MSIEKKVPEIRFKGFSGEWEESEFSGIATRVSTQHKSTCLPCVEYEDIVAGKGLFNKDIYQKKTFKAGLKFEIDDVVFGKLRPYLKNWFLADFEGIAVGDFWVLRADIVASTFLFSLIQTNKFEFISNLSAGSKMPRSDWGLVSSSCFFIPKNICESDKIGNTFQKLDSLINQHQQKHDKLSNIKKAMLEKMFPKQGETIPEIRFKGFSGDWEEQLLGNKMTVTSVKRILQSDWTTSGVRFLRARDIVSSYKNEEPADYLYIAREKYEQYSQLSGKVEVGDLLVTGVGTIGVPMLITNEDPVYFKDGNIIWFKNENAINGLFLFYSFVGKQIKTYIKHSAGTGTVGTYTINSGKNTPIKLPKSEEQTAIGNYFQKLDTLINQHQQQITKLNNIKQACLNKMFI
ncbi:restriction endonuclease subunit S [Shewanella sp. SG44-6]|uniref:restriction endonuclease subunit S n=1 Tax=Shewanella sp. SG44-6 TaxID=2760959 RepID=UPI001602AF33|nr:restriction endonuclease subunit S [Shewanella sp. SG44-6]MBB1389835.1 restriction endonuclease subunit S [Shewanella sp. SG44-6]